MKVKFVLTVVLSITTVLFTSCDKCVEYGEAENQLSSVSVIDEQTAMIKFAEIVSRATYNRQDVREFLKKEAIKQFDKNYDVLYCNVKDSYIGNETFQEILNHYAASGELESIEHSVPTINIFIPKITMFNITPENLDCSEKEIPIALSGDINNKIYIDGNVVDTIARGDLPGFHVFVINKNSRVCVSSTTRSLNRNFCFISPEYDNIISKSTTRSTPMDASIVGSKAIAAYSYFNKDDGSKYSKALQRDYIYYGMIPSSTSGSLNQAVTEYISFIEIDPKAYFKITDKKDINEQTDDPEIKNYTVSRKKRDFTTEELINELWTEGCYNLKIEILTSISNRPLIKYLALSPDDIWEFNLDKSYRHSTGFRHSKYTYTISPNKFTSKRIYLTPNNISFGKWDLANESLTREVSFVEQDPGESYTYEYAFETTKVNSTKVNGDIKFGLGIGDNDKDKVEFGLGAERTNSTTTKESNKIIVNRTNKDDELGTEKIYFYDPIVEGVSGLKYITKEYNTGIVTFGITAI